MFDLAWSLAAEHTLLDVTRARLLYQLVEVCLEIPGAFCEFGVYRGGSAVLIAAAIGDRELHLYDTFNGIAEADARYDNGHSDGDFGGEGLEAAVRALVPQAILHVGQIAKTLADDIGAIAFAHVDVDVFQAHREVLAYVWPRLSPGGFILFDDWTTPSCLGARRAIDEFSAAEGVSIKPGFCGQGWTQKPSETI